MTEVEHHCLRPTEHNLEAARVDESADKVMVTSGEQFPLGATGANLNLAFSSQTPVDTFPPSHTGHHDVTGNAWEWTEDNFNPLKGFEVHHVYDDFSTPCFDNKHNMIVGGSFISTGDEASVFARFHFRPHFLQHSTIRLVHSKHETPSSHVSPDEVAKSAMATMTAPAPESSSTATQENVYESNTLLSMYYGLHFPHSGKKEGVAPILPHNNSPDHGLSFPQRVAQLLIEHAKPTEQSKALDIGCAVGGSSFELAKHFGHVDGFDFSQSFVDGAKRMQADERPVFQVPIEADLHHEVEAVHDPSVTREIRDRCNFFQGDACSLTGMAEEGKLATDYDGVIMSNLICRLPDPRACLNGLNGILNENGVVIMVTPFSWLDEFTHRSQWLGGFYDPVTKEPIHSIDVLRGIMYDNGFEQIHDEEIVCVIREHQRKYQYIVPQATGWRKIK